jgi:hypothetical protein
VSSSNYQSIQTVPYYEWINWTTSHRSHDCRLGRELSPSFLDSKDHYGMRVDTCLSLVSALLQRNVCRPLCLAS